jgi:hypothetical protein
VLGYNQTRQRELLAWLGFEDVHPARLIGLLALLIALVMGVYVVATRPRAPRPDPLQRAYLKFCRKLARIGLVRAPQEGALAFAERVDRQRPELADSILNITHLYLRLRYGGVKDANQYQELINRVSALRVRRS